MKGPAKKLEASFGILLVLDRIVCGFVGPKSVSKTNYIDIQVMMV